MGALAEIHDIAGRVASYAALAFSVATSDPARGALMQKVEERLTQVETRLLFWDLEWAALPEERAQALLADPGLEFCAHHLRSARRYRPHLLSEPEEKILAEKSLTARSAWTRLFEQHTAGLRASLPDVEEPVALEVALSRLQSNEREERRIAAEAVTAALTEDLRTPTFIFNTLLADKMVDDRLRAYPTWLSSRNLSNEVSDPSVQALLSAIRARNDIPQRWYALKAKLLGLPKLADYDRAASVADEEETIGFPDARELVLV
jgi:oligoendopeptidase F